jgi:uncharacterized ParB-like nuclease family protein
VADDGSIDVHMVPMSVIHRPVPSVLDDAKVRLARLHVRVHAATEQH